jgi:hypothetical protein
MKTMQYQATAGLIPAVLIALSTLAPVQAETVQLANFTFGTTTGVGFTRTTTVTQDNTIVSSFTDGPAYTAVGSGTGNPAASYAVTTNNLSGSFNANAYGTFTVTAQAGYILNLNTLSFDVQNAGAAPTPDGQWVVRSSVDNFTTNLADFTATTSFVNKQVDVSTIVFEGLQDITFRIYLYDANNTNSGTKSLRTDNVILTGDIVAIPEPSTSAALFGLVGAALVFWRMRGK